MSPLDQLRDIHLPAPVSIWPLAPGWWLLLALAAGLAVAAGFGWRYWVRHRRYRRHALRQLAQLEQQTLSDREYLDLLALLVKHTALCHDPAAASLAGWQWQQQLQTAMPADAARLIAVDRYQPQQTIDRAQLGDAVRQWIRSH